MEMRVIPMNVHLAVEPVTTRPKRAELVMQEYCRITWELRTVEVLYKLPEELEIEHASALSGMLLLRISPMQGLEAAEAIMSKYYGPKIGAYFQIEGVMISLKEEPGVVC